MNDADIPRDAPAVPPEQAARPALAHGAIDAQPDRPSARADARAVCAALPALSGLHILLVDDALDALHLLESLLQLEGAEVVAVDNGPQALAEAGRTHFDLLLSDVAMPGMDGYALIAALRQTPGAHLPAIAVTGCTRPLDARRALAAGFDAHLAKPIVVDALLQAIDRVRRVQEKDHNTISRPP